jgi:NTE family protein
MPFGSEGLTEQIGLAMSGGGFRATLFHVGTLRRLVELGLLTKVGRISSISGGSIAAGRLAQVWAGFAANPTVANFDSLVAGPLREFCSRTIDGGAIATGILSPFSSAGEEIEKEYARRLLGITLDQLPDSPVFVIGATNIQTGRSFRFTKKYMGDYRIGLVEDPKLPLARAVAASSAFPPVLSPVVIKNPGTFKPVKGADLAGNPAFTRTLSLTDGGVYDNLGLETVWNRCKTILVSDAGAPFAFGETVHTDLVRQTIRALDIATDQSRGLRKRALIDDFKRKERAGAYWGIDTLITDYKPGTALACKPERVLPLAQMRTRLNKFSDQEQGELINWGYALTDAALHAYAPQLLGPTPAAAQWPIPKWALDR